MLDTFLAEKLYFFCIFPRIPLNNGGTQQIELIISYPAQKVAADVSTKMGGYEV
jgi:hypothetical protein